MYSNKHNPIDNVLEKMFTFYWQAKKVGYKLVFIIYNRKKKSAEQTIPENQ